MRYLLSPISTNLARNCCVLLLTTSLSKGMAKAYQVRQVLRAIDRLEAQSDARNDRYTYRVTWAEEDKECVGLCVEFPSLSWLASTPEAALEGIRRVTAEVVAGLDASGEFVPEPIAVRQYSGKFVVQIPPGLHRRLALEAAEAGVSLDRLASAKLSQ